MTAPSAPPSRRRLAAATAAAAVAAAVVLVVAVLPAEYGIDPTGIGAMAGLTKLSGAPDEETPSEEAAAPLVLRTYESRFALGARDALDQDGYLSEGDTLVVPFVLDAPNLTRVTMRLEFIDANATPSGERTRADTFEIELKAPNGDVSGPTVLRSDPNTGVGRGEATFHVRAAPAPRAIEAQSEDEARRVFLTNDPPDLGQTGEWRARITMLEAQDGDVQGATLPGVPGTAASDDGNAWTLTVVFESYALDVVAKPGSERRSDRVTLQLGPGGELEYKLRVGLGARVDYSWRTDGADVYVDFHGEKEGDESGAFTRHKNGEFAADAGTLVAPFDGRHGWYWRNAGHAIVTITLDTSGQYEVIGRV